MGNAMAFLKKKGPLGMPMGFYVALGAVVLYLGYRWYKNRNASSSSSATDTTGTTDTTGDQTPAAPSGIDVTSPPAETVPPSTEQPPPVTTGTPGKKDHHGTHHDHKQGHKHTNRRHLPKRGSRHNHAPIENKREHSNQKKERTRNVREHKPGERKPVEETRRHPSATASKSRVAKHPPVTPREEHNHDLKAKSPPQKRTRVPSSPRARAY